MSNKKFSYLIVFLIIFTLVTEVADASSSSRRRRRRAAEARRQAALQQERYDKCINEVSKLSPIKIDCSQVNRYVYLHKVFENSSFDYCSDARSDDSSISPSAKAQHEAVSTINQCFGESKLTKDDKVYLKELALKQEEERLEQARIQAERQAQMEKEREENQKMSKNLFLIVLSGFSIFVFAKFALFIFKRKD